jgi:hypothetical protein
MHKYFYTLRFIMNVTLRNDFIKKMFKQGELLDKYLTESI